MCVRGGPNLRKGEVRLVDQAMFGEPPPHAGPRAPVRGDAGNPQFGRIDPVVEDETPGPIRLDQRPRERVGDPRDRLRLDAGRREDLAARRFCDLRKPPPQIDEERIPVEHVAAPLRAHDRRGVARDEPGFDAIRRSARHRFPRREAFSDLREERRAVLGFLEELAQFGGVGLDRPVGRAPAGVDRLDELHARRHGHAGVHPASDEPAQVGPAFHAEGRGRAAGRMKRRLAPARGALRARSGSRASGGVHGRDHERQQGRGRARPALSLWLHSHHPSQRRPRRTARERAAARAPC